MGVDVDLELFPLLRLSLPEVFNPPDVQVMYDGLKQVTGREGHYVTVVDTTSIRRMPDAVTRRALADGGREFEQHALKWSLGTAIVIASPLVRGAHTAFNWIRGDRFNVPEVSMPTLAEANAWAVEQLKSKDALTDAVREYVERQAVATQ